MSLSLAGDQHPRIAADDDGGEGLNSRLRFVPPKTGPYQVVATSFAGGAGTYTLKIRSEGAAKPAAKPIALKIGDGKAELQGQLAATDTPDPVRNHPAKAHTLKMEKDKTYVIDLRSGVVKAWLRFEGEISELYDVMLLPGVKNPTVLPLDGAEFDDVAAPSLG